jgi:hypothetical protein
VRGFTGDLVVGKIEALAHQSSEVAVGEVVDDVAPVATGLDESGEPELGQMLADGSAGGAGGRSELADVGGAAIE